MKGQKINAIKHYRKKMCVTDKNGEVKGPSLKESKEYVDNLQEKFKLRSRY